MVNFAGWKLPVQYQSALEEHHSVRQAVGVFDVSHMGQIEIRGKDALQIAQRATCNDVHRLVDGQAQYSALLTNEGTFLDDLVVYRLSSEHLLMCVNAATVDKDFDWLKQLPEGDATIDNTSDNYAQIAVQGPLAELVLQPLVSADLSQIKFYRFVQGRVGHASAIISRTGYTGEPGFELYLAPEHAEQCWRDLFKAGEDHGITACGLAARNTLRLEMRYPLYGHDIDETRTPYEAGLGWIVREETDFIGRQALLEQKERGPGLKLVGFELNDRGVARDGYAVYIDGKEVGAVTSGGYSPSLKKSIGLVYLPVEQAIIDQAIEIEVRDKFCGATVVQTPFYKKA